MLRLEFSRLPPHHQTLYKLLACLLAGAFLVGLIWTLLGFSDQRLSQENDWQPTSLSAGEDVTRQYLIVSENPRWLVAVGTKSKPQPQLDPLKELEGKPESLRLTGLVKSGDKTYALFLPLIPTTNAETSSAIRQLAEGDTLVGGWTIKTINANQVEIQQGDETRSLKMYQPSPK
uniref:hypothetical protein n=1 Tax=Cellvibrio fontiphilus TaxID=1815559 RepID=UPI002B4BD9C8|nr:hypothetical protein [Cellvibrio fontiphilus]